MKKILLFLFFILITSGSANTIEFKVFDLIEKELSILDVRKVRGAKNSEFILSAQMRMVVF